MRASLLGMFSAIALGLAFFLAAGGDGDEEVVRASGKILPAQGKQPARLQVTAKIKSGWHIYSITQKSGGPITTKIKVPESPQYKVGEFKALTPPTSHPEPAFDNLIVEEHSGEAVWEAPLTVAGGAIGSLKIAGAVYAQACKTSCLPPTDYKFEATAGAAGKKEVSVAPDAQTHATRSGPAVADERPATAAHGQRKPSRAKAFEGKNLFKGFGDDDQLMSAGAEILPAEGKQPARLRVTAKVKAGWHTFSITQSPGGPKATKIKVAPSPLFTLGPFQAITPPVSHPAPETESGTVEEHSGEVVWEAPLNMSADVKDLRVTGAVNAQVCQGKLKCVPATDYPFEATIGDVSKLPPNAVASKIGEDEPAARSAISPAGGEKRRLGSVEFRGPSGHLTLRGRLEPPVVAPGGKARIVISAAPEPPFHFYALAASDQEEIGRGKPTLVKLNPTRGLRFQEPVADATLISHPSPHAALNVERYYSGAVDFSVDVEVAADAASGKQPIAGVISFQTCTLGKKDQASCDLPQGARFEAALEVVPAEALAESDQSPASLLFKRAKYNQSPADVSLPAEPAAAPARLRIVELNSSEERSLVFMLGCSFLGGLILNLMPCVLPVIGLKLLSFVGQGGQSRSRVLTLNLWYTAGLLSVFVALATLACAASLGLAKQNLGWGEQFTAPQFNIVMCCVVFAMALSFVGVWEIPIPGFVGRGKSAELAAQEGPAGAFFKGVMSTLLATPCSGPFLGAVFGFTLEKAPAVIYLIHGFIGLGMASPYLVIGAFPALIRWLPKPGAWMDTFKQAMGFTLLATVIYLLSILDAKFLLPTLGLLLGIGVACWWIGRAPGYADASKQLVAWGAGGVMGAAIGYAGFNLLSDHKALLPWRPFTASAPGDLAAAGKTVMVDFTANWCPTCNTNLATAIDTVAVKRLVAANGVVPLKADWSKESDEIKQALGALKSKTIPLLAIYPAGHPDEVLLLRDLVTQGQVLSALKRAGPSDDAPPPEAERVSSIAPVGGDSR